MLTCLLPCLLTVCRNMLRWMTAIFPTTMYCTECICACMQKCAPDPPPPLEGGEQRKHEIKEGNRGIRRQIMLPILWFKLLSSERNQFSVSPLRSSPQQLADAFPQSLYIHTIADWFPRSPWKFRRQIKWHFCCRSLLFPYVTIYFLWSRGTPRIGTQYSRMTFKVEYLYEFNTIFKIALG